MDPKDYIVPMHPEESYSRRLDEMVAAQELPYGYDGNAPPADTGDYDQRRLESDKQYPMRNGRAV